MPPNDRNARVRKRGREADAEREAKFNAEIDIYLEQHKALYPRPKEPLPSPERSPAKSRGGE